MKYVCKGGEIMLMYLLVFTFFILLFLIYVFTDKDITAPAFVYILGYFVSSCITACNVNYWKVDLQWETFLIMLYGTSLFCIPSILIQKFYKRRYYQVTDGIVAKPLEYNQLYLRLFCLFQFVFILIWIWYLRQFFISVGQIDNLSQAMQIYRTWSSYSTAPNNDILYVMLSRIFSNIIISANLLSTVVVYNYVITRQWKNEAFSIISIIFTIILMLLQGGRGGVVWIAINIVMLYFLFEYKINKSKKEINFKFICKIFMISISGAIIFYLLKVIVGRGGIDLSLSAITQYISFYVGGQTQLLDLFITNPIEQSPIWGKETFHILNEELIKFGILDEEPYIWHLEFRYAETGVFLGNSYPSYRSYLYDFGYLGLTIFPVIFSIIVNVLYYRYYYKKGHEISLALLFYVSIFYSIFFDFSRSVFFSSFASLLSIKIIFMLALYYLIFIKNEKLKI